MASFLKRLLGGHEPPPPALNEATSRLDELIRTRPAIAGPARAMRDVLTRLFAELVADVPAAIAPEIAQARLTEGTPLLRGEPVAGPEALRQSWAQVAAALEPHRHSAAVKALAQAAKNGALDPSGLLADALGGRSEVIGEKAESLGLDASLAATILRLAALPVLAPSAPALGSLARDAGWNRGYCPICGSWPLLGEYRGLEQTRFLRCGLCAGSWAFSRMQCPFCNEQDYRKLGYLHVEEEQDRWRAATCDSCQGYVKMVSSLDALSWPLLLVQDVATLHLDLVAADRGFLVR